MEFVMVVCDGCSCNVGSSVCGVDVHDWWRHRRGSYAVRTVVGPFMLRLQQK
jgi:hypothetical protein